MARRSANHLRQRCLDSLGDESMLFADGLDAAIIGFAWRDGVVIVVYDAQTIIDILCRRDGMEQEEAWEFFDYNIQGAWKGAMTPIYLKRV
jgi:hypothetical protein